VTRGYHEEDARQTQVLEEPRDVDFLHHVTLDIINSIRPATCRRFVRPSPKLLVLKIYPAVSLPPKTSLIVRMNKSIAFLFDMFAGIDWVTQKLLF
jgi:hypothetical protein